MLAGSIFLAVLAMGATSSSSAQRIMQETDPKTYWSQNRTYSLYVDPSNREGAGSGTYTLSKGGKKLWTVKLPFTFWGVAVADDGRAAGYAYSHGYEGFDPSGKDRGEGTLSFVLLNADGKPTVLETFKRAMTRMMHAPPYPLAKEVMLDPSNDRVIFRGGPGGSGESWHVYRLSTGKLAASLSPLGQMKSPGSATFILSAKLVPGTPLVLLHWWCFDGMGKLGARFTLVDEEARPVWTLDLPDDYTVPGSEKAQDRLTDQVQTYGAILGASDGAFVLRFAKANQRVSFAVKSAGEGKWDVRETGRSAYSVPKSLPPAKAAIPERKLRLVKKIDLQAPGLAGEHLRWSSDIGNAGPGKFAWLTQNDAGTAYLIVASEAGNVVRKVSLAQLKADPNKRVWSGCAHVGRERFVVFQTEHGEPQRAFAWSVNAATGSIAQVKGFQAPWIQKVAACPKGGFVALATSSYKYTMTTGLYAYDSSGKLRWHREEPMGSGPNDPPETLFSPEGVAVTPDGRVAVIDNIRHTIQVFGPTGKFLKLIDLNKTWATEASYPADIAATNTRFAVVDSMSPTYLTDASGRKVATLRTRFADGRPFDVFRGVAFGKDGRVWTSDGEALLRLDAKGVVDRVVGTAPNAERLGEIARLAIGPKDQIYAVDARSNAVHVFDAAGKPLLVMKPRPAEFLSFGPPGDLQVTRSGDVFLWGAFVKDDCGWLHFSPRGSRVGVQFPEESKTATDSSSGVRWAHGSLLDAKGQVLAKVERGADGRFLQFGYTNASAPDGLLAMLSGVRLGGRGQPIRVSLYSKAGAPVRYFEVPAGLKDLSLEAYDGQRVFLLSGNRIVCLNTFGKVLWGFTPALPKKSEVAWVLLTDGGRTLLVMPFTGRTVYKYALP